MAKTTPPLTAVEKARNLLASQILRTMIHAGSVDPAPTRAADIAFGYADAFMARCKRRDAEAGGDGHDTPETKANEQ